MLHQVAAVLNGTDFMGKPTRQGPVVLLTEEGKSTYAGALRRAGLMGHPNLHICEYAAVRGQKWPAVAAAAIRKVQEAGAILLVIDTASKWMGIRGEEENSAGAWLERLDHLATLRDMDCAVLINHHDRRASKGDVADSGRGTNAFTGEVDQVVNLRKPAPTEGFRDGERVIGVLGRFEINFDALVVRLESDRYVAVGEPTDGTAGSARSAVDYDIIKLHLAGIFPKRATAADLAIVIGKTKEAARRVVERLVDHDFAGVDVGTRNARLYYAQGVITHGTTTATT
jgi:hypothetical protein